MIVVAEQTGISPSVLSRIRTGARAPTGSQVTALAKILGMDVPEQERFTRLAERMRLPPTIRERLLHEEAEAESAFSERRSSEQRESQLRACNDFNDGWWLSYSHSFRNDGLVQRSLVRVEGAKVSIQVMDGGALRYSYHGHFEILGDKIFVRAAEDRGDAEYLQVVLHSLFDVPEPVLLYGMVCGISGRDLHHPLAVPAASRILLLYAGTLDLPRATLSSLQALLGGLQPANLTPCWPSLLGPDRPLRSALRLGDGDLDAAILRLIDNHVAAGDHVLRADLR